MKILKFIIKGICLLFVLAVLLMVFFLPFLGLWCAGAEMYKP